MGGGGVIGQTLPRRVLLDREMDHPVVGEIREAVVANSNAELTRIADLHVWRVGRASYSCALSPVTEDAALSTKMSVPRREQGSCGATLRRPET
jgi:hypothetical protein